MPPRRVRVLTTITTRAELEQRIAEARGFLYNDYGGRNPQLCPIHDLAACPWLASMVRVAPGPLTVSKLWSTDLAELVREIERRGKVYAACRSEPHTMHALSQLVPSGSEAAEFLPPN